MNPVFDAAQYRYPSRRHVVYSTRGMVCTSQQLAAGAGLDMLKQGGNAVDAAIATAICLMVVDPTSNGLGSDAFALVWIEGTLYGLNGSGYAPQLLTPGVFEEAGVTEMPERGWESVTVPGAPSAWAELHKRFGKLPFATLFEPAIYYAEQGYPVSPHVAKLWQAAAKTFTPFAGDAVFQPFFTTFMRNGRAPRIGEIMRLPSIGKTLRLLAKSHCESYYRGAIALDFDAHAKKTGGYIRLEDLAAYRAEWVTPIHTNYRGYDVWEIPPNGHGIVALMALNILSGYDLGDERDTTLSFHLQLEAMKQAYVDGRFYVADPHYMKMKTDYLLSEDYAKLRRLDIGKQALLPKPCDPSCGGTVYLCTADGEGNMVSFIQSNFKGFGSGIVIPGYGISLNDRANNFTLDPQSDNYLQPRKKPYHTIIPGFLTKDGKAVGPFGVMGGFMQPQGHVQVVANTVDFHMNPQEALDAPRWQWLGGRQIEVEPGVSPQIVEGLRKRGHEVRINQETAPFGRGQIIWRDESSGVLMGATEPRADGVVAAW